MVEARLLVDASGKVTKCTSLTHVDAPAFEKAVCGAFSTRAKFAPAELADGTKVPSYYTITTRFVVPR
ncbi:MAG: energy transducer TonB [Sphingomonas bacterium]|nr:energy transducer TonB [Sphingomonas bacterium]